MDPAVVSIVFVYVAGGAVVVVGGTVVDGTVPVVASVVVVETEVSVVVVVTDSLTLGVVVVGDVDGTEDSPSCGCERVTVTRAEASEELSGVGASVTCDRTLPTAAVAMTTATRVATSHAIRIRILPRMMTV
jgi:hypothetical protein